MNDSINGSNITTPKWFTILAVVMTIWNLMGVMAFFMQILLISLIGGLVQMYHSFFIANSIEVYGLGSAIMHSMVVVIAIFLVWLVNNPKAKAWIN